MESKEGKKFNFKIGGIFAIAVVAAIVGTLAFTSFQTNSDSNTNTQSIGIGAFVTVEVFNEDGDLSHTWEGHNMLSTEAQNALVKCITGLDSAPFGFDSCVLGVDTIRIIAHHEATNVQLPVIDKVGTISGIPATCTEGFQKNCTGWSIEATFDFDTLDCTPTVDCIKVTQLITINPPAGGFNFVNPPPIPIEPNDRLVVSLTFDIPT